MPVGLPIMTDETCVKVIRVSMSKSELPLLLMSLLGVVTEL